MTILTTFVIIILAVCHRLAMKMALRVFIAYRERKQRLAEAYKKYNYTPQNK